MNTKRDYKSFDFFLAFFVISLSIFGIILIGSATGMGTVAELPKEFKGQIIWVTTGVIIMILMSFIDFQFICRFYMPIYILNIFLLIFVLIYGRLTNAGLYRSIDLPGGGSIQPSEFNKIFMIIFLAKFIDNGKEKINNIFFLGSVFLLTIFPVILIMAEPSLSASLVTVVIMTIMLFIAKLNYKYILMAFLIILPLSGAFVYDINTLKAEKKIEIIDDKKETEFIIHYNTDSFGPIIVDKVLEPYQIYRLKTFLEPSEDDDSGAGYQNMKALLAIGSGQLSGKGAFNKEVYVPESTNDFVFTVLAEEYGFIGSLISIGAIFLIVTRCFIIASRSEVFYGRLIAGAVGGMIAFQTFANVGVTTGILPNTGMIFPFISSGGSAMWVFMACIGLVINIGMTKTKSMFRD